MNDDATADEAKRRGELVSLAEDVSAHWKAAVARGFEVLDAALARSVLPDEPRYVAEIERWLVMLRWRGLTVG